MLKFRTVYCMYKNFFDGVASQGAHGVKNASKIDFNGFILGFEKQVGIISKVYLI